MSEEKEIVIDSIPESNNPQINAMYAYSSRIIQNSKKAKTKAKGLIHTDTQYRLKVAEIYKLFEKADKLAIQKRTDKLKKVEKEIIALSLEILDYERFRMKNP